METITVLLVVAFLLQWAYISFLRGELGKTKLDRDHGLKWSSHYRAELDRARVELLAALNRPVTPAPGRERPSAFVPEEEAMPHDIAAALDSYPPELAEPTRLWITQQRRMRVDWNMIRRRVIGGVGGRLEDSEG